MKVFAISDLHLSSAVDKPMDIFGGAWENYWDVVKEDWASKVSEDDVVLLAGDLSWGMAIEEARPDLEALGELKGKKIIIKGNHDYWWSSYSKVASILPEGVYAIQNNCVKIGECVFAGSRGWVNAQDNAEDAAIYRRELLRLGMSLDAAAKAREEGDRLFVMTHYPPFDASFKDSAVTRLIAKYSPDAVVYGHLHGRDCRAKAVVDKDGVPYYLTSCDLMSNKLVRVY